MKFESVYFELTNICNLNCKTCYNRSGLNKERKEIPLDSLFSAIETFHRYGLQSVHLSGGETMLYSEIQPLFERIAATPNMYFTMTTNGTVNGKLLLTQYRKNKNFFVQVSLDGSCEEVNAKTRGQGRFAKALTVLKGLRDSERPVGYRIKMVLSKYNIEDIPAYFRLAAEYNCEPQFAFMSLIGNGLENQEDMLLSDMDKMKALRYIDEGNKAYGMQVKLPFCAFSGSKSKQW